MFNTDVDLSRLTGVLKNANKVMNKVESGAYSSKPKNQVPMNENVHYDYGDEYEETETQVPTQPKISPNSDVYKERLNKTKLPESVKRAMLEEPIETPDYTNSLSEADLYDDEDRMPDFTPDRVKQQLHERLERKKQPQQRNSNMGGDMITINKNELNSLIQENVVKFLSIYFTKNITEKSVKQTLKQMLSEGKIRTK